MQSSYHHETSLIHSEKIAPEAFQEMGGRSLAIAGGLLGGAVDAIGGGAAWTAVTIMTHHEIGIVASGIGVAAGVLTLVLSGGRKGLMLQMVAVASAIFGILVGKYGNFYWFYRQAIERRFTARFGPEAALEALSNLSLFSGEFANIFMETFNETLSPYDFLWAGLAVYSAWGIAQADRGPEQVMQEH